MVDISDDNYDLDLSRAKALLDWEPKHRLRDALPQMIAALKKNPVEWYRKNDLPLPGFLKKSEGGKEAPQAAQSAA
jgi:hypothetical protein